MYLYYTRVNRIRGRISPDLRQSCASSRWLRLSKQTCHKSLGRGGQMADCEVTVAAQWFKFGKRTSPDTRSTLPLAVRARRPRIASEQRPVAVVRFLN